MVTIAADTTGMREAAEALERAGAGVMQGIPQVMGKAVVMVAGEAKRLAPVHMGRLRAGVTEEVRGAALETVGVVGDNVEYAPPVELGSRPHWPPWGPGTALARWAELHGTSAFVVALAISRRGTKARRFLQGAYEGMKDKVIGLFVNLVKGIKI